MRLDYPWDVPPPLHNLLMPHDTRYRDERSCPPNCPFRLWAEKRAADIAEAARLPEETPDAPA